MKTESIKCTFEEEKNGQIPFLDTLIVRKPDGSIKPLVYRKSTHTDQYLNFKSEHPLYQKMGVIRKLFDRMNSVVTETEEKIKEEERVCAALKNCGYPDWAMDKVKNQLHNKTKDAVKLRSKKSKTAEEKSKGMVVIPYVSGHSERIRRAFIKHKVDRAMKLHCTLRQILVHPKDKREKEMTGNCFYEIGCKNCHLSYVGETSRMFGTRLAEHKVEVKKANKAQDKKAQNARHRKWNRPNQPYQIT
ncbi:uncharacterized protein [Amphiura filiformis]|uniref:uncharacterized protein n=1 Tax=Amphiura filiformis TaxID=82378 RepID=UPI003B210EA4